MEFYNENTNTILSQKEYIELVEREAKQVYAEYLESLEEDEEIESFESLLSRMFEMESDFVALDDNEDKKIKCVWFLNDEKNGGTRNESDNIQDSN